MEGGAARSVPRLVERGDAAADPRRGDVASLPGIRRALSDARGAGCRAARRCPRALQRTRLLRPGAPPARRGKGGGGARRIAAIVGGAEEAAWIRSLYRRGGREPGVRGASGPRR